MAVLVKPCYDDLPDKKATSLVAIASPHSPAGYWHRHLPG